MSTQPVKEIPEKVRVTSYPKIIYLWPTMLISFILWLYAIIGSVPVETAMHQTIGWIWMGVFIFNIFVITFEFSAGKFLVILALLFALLIAVLVIPELQVSIWLPNLGMTRDFYLVTTLIMAIVFGLLWLSRRFNYLEITHQQISYHVGIFADERRYPAPGCHFEKRTEDVFERVMPPFCAKLILKTGSGEIAEVMECVPFINTRLADIKKILDYIQVRPGST